MGVCVSGVKVAGFSVGGKPVAGLAANGIVIWRRPSEDNAELIVNGGFEDGTNGWQVNGLGQVITSDNTIPRTPYEGSSYFKSTTHNGGVQQTIVVSLAPPTVSASLMGLPPAGAYANACLRIGTLGMCCSPRRLHPPRQAGCWSSSITRSLTR